MVSRLAVASLAAVHSLVLVVLTPESSAERLRSERLRVIVETDAGGDPDDEQSMVRFLLYANEWDVEGIVCNREKARDGENLNPVRSGLGIVRSMVEAYGACWPNLVRHDRHYPPPKRLLERTVSGYEDSEAGVELILRAADSKDPRPVWFLNWGTENDCAPSSLKRALDRVLAERGQEAYRKFKSRFRLSSDDQFGDHTWKTEPPFPLWVDTFRPPVDRRRWYHRFSGITAKAGGFDIERDVRTGHGPLGAMYPLNTTHPQKEGDTMSFLYLVPNGMNDPYEPGWGSWAGRYAPREGSDGRAYFWASATDAWNGTAHRDNSLIRWAADLQNDFRARLVWCVQGPKEANHPPRPAVAGSATRRVRPGELVRMDARRSHDPDGDLLSFRWLFYPEAGSAKAVPTLSSEVSPETQFVVPAGLPRSTLHLILAVTDSGSPPLTRYRRIVFEVSS